MRYDNSLKLNISNLKKLGYLENNTLGSGVINWYLDKIQISSVSIKSNNLGNSKSITLHYNYNGENKDYQIKLTSIQSNLGIGVCWYFICPKTSKRCRNLYFGNGLFLHRDAFNNSMYLSQTRSKKWRYLDHVYGTYYDSDKYYLELYSKHFKRHYKGKPTKRYLKLKNKIDIAENSETL